MTFQAKMQNSEKHLKQNLVSHKNTLAIEPFTKFHGKQQRERIIVPFHWQRPFKDRRPMYEHADV